MQTRLEKACSPASPVSSRPKDHLSCLPPELIGEIFSLAYPPDEPGPSFPLSRHLLPFFLETVYECITITGFDKLDAFCKTLVGALLVASSSSHSASVLTYIEGAKVDLKKEAKDSGTTTNKTLTTVFKLLKNLRNFASVGRVASRSTSSPRAFLATVSPSSRSSSSTLRLPTLETPSTFLCTSTSSSTTSSSPLSWSSTTARPSRSSHSPNSLTRRKRSASYLSFSTSSSTVLSLQARAPRISSGRSHVPALLETRQRVFLFLPHSRLRHSQSPPPRQPASRVAPSEVRPGAYRSARSPREPERARTHRTEPRRRYTHPYDALRKLEVLRHLTFGADAAVSTDGLEALVSGSRKHPSLKHLTLGNVYPVFDDEDDEDDEPEPEQYISYITWTNIFDEVGLVNLLDAARKAGVEVDGEALHALEWEQQEDEEFFREHGCG